MTVARGWTYISDDGGSDDEIVRETTRIKLNLLMERWSKIQTDIENESFMPDDYEYRDEVKDLDPEEQARHEAFADIKDRSRRDELVSIETQLAELGARPMRPYEHWNEDERYMEYMENRYDNEC